MRMKDKAEMKQLERFEDQLAMIISSDFTKSFWSKHCKRMASGLVFELSYSQLLADIMGRFDCKQAIATATVDYIVETGYYLEMYKGVNKVLEHYARQALQDLNA